MVFPIFIYRWGVYHWKDFRFPNGTSKNKYWIALVCRVIDPKNNSEELIPSLIPTSQWEKYQSHSQWLIDTVVLEPKESQFFPKKTVIDLKNIQWVKKDLIFKALEDKKLTHLGTLEKEVIQKIEEAIENSVTLSWKDIKILLCREE
jgi:hypothetical protein